jgi:FKBP-type peptidyl-prolyl cis-trans isomerase FklB
MKVRLTPLYVFAVLLIVALAHAEEQTVLKSQKEKLSYLIGVDIGRNLKARSADVDLNALVLGLKDTLAGNQLRLTEEEMKKLVAAFNEEMEKQGDEKVKGVSERNRRQGEEFLAENRKKKGVVVLKSGLQYKVITKGAGKSPIATDMVTIHYRGTLMDGKEFASSYSQGQPATFRVNTLIPGWAEALQLMKKGSKWQLFVPSNLASGKRSVGGHVIPPHPVLIYEVELISVKEAPRLADSSSQLLKSH